MRGCHENADCNDSPRPLSLSKGALVSTRLRRELSRTLRRTLNRRGVNDYIGIGAIGKDCPNLPEEIRMASEKWVSVKQEWCDLLQQEVVMLERRVFPDDVIPDPQNYRVMARKCSADTTCNMAGYPCNGPIPTQS